MRIAVFCPTVTGKGGMEAAIQNLLTGFEELGDQARLFLFGGSEDVRWLEGMKVSTFGSPRSSRLARMVGYAYGPAFSIASWKPDAIICADVTSMVMARLGRRLALRKKLPIASWVHFPLPIIRMKEKLPEADLHLAISDEFASDIRDFIPSQKDKVFTIFNAVEVERCARLPRPQRTAFLYVGRLTWDDHKRVNDLLLAVSRLRGEWHLKIVGAAPDNRPEYEPRLRAYAEELGIDDRITWYGWQADPWKAIGEASVLVIPSEHEAFGMVIVEAMARGVPVVSSACGGGPAAIIEEGRNGWLYPVADIDALQARLQSILSEPATLPDQQSIVNSVQRFSPKAVASRARQALLTQINSATSQ